MESRSNPILDFLLLLLGRKRLVLGIVLPTMVAVAVYSLAMDRTYESTALIVPPAGGSSPLLGMLGDLPMGDLLGGLGGLPGGGGGGEYYTAILSSNLMRAELIERFDLKTYYELPDAKFEELLEILDDKVSASLDFETGMISLAVRDKDPARAREMADWLIERLEELNRDFRTRRARLTREFVGGQVAGVRADLDSLEQDLLDFQRRQRVLEPEAQAQAVIGRYGELKGQEAVKQLELDMVRRLRGAANPEVARLESELAAIRDRLEASYERGDSDLFLAVAELPQATVEFLRRQRELEIANKKLVFLLPQLEQAKIDEVNDTPVLEVLDPPRVAEKRIKPRRTVMVLAAGAVSLVVASLLTLFQARLAGNPALAGQWSGVVGHLRRLARLKLD